MRCEYCEKEHDGSYGSGRFCQQECSRGYSTRAKRKDINKKVRAKLIKRELTSGICENCGQEHDGSYGKGRFCNSVCRQSFVSKKGWEIVGRNGAFSNKETRDKSRLAQDRKLQEHYGSLEFKDLPKIEIKRRLTKKQNGACLFCGIEEWQGNPIVLQLDHINGSNFDNSEENVRLLCPNCHSQTETHSGKNVNKGKKVDDEELIDALKRCDNVATALKRVGLTPKAGHYSRCYRLMIENGIEILRH